MEPNNNPNVYVTTRLGADLRTSLINRLGARLRRAAAVVLEAENIYADNIRQRDGFVSGTPEFKEMDRTAERVLKRMRDIEHRVVKVDRVTGTYEPGVVSAAQKQALLGNPGDEKAPLYRALVRETLKVSPKISHRSLSDALGPIVKDVRPEDKFEDIKAVLFATLGIIAPEEAPKA